ncbi:hypothetical protein WA158_008074 [Blastocystis sp. Blastoise]
MGYVLLLTGKPGVGKSTIIQEVCKRIQDPYRGFYTGEIRENGRRSGFSITTFSGQQSILSSTQFVSENYPKVGSYGVSIENINKTIVNEINIALREKCPLVVVDEIGKMEMLSNEYKSSIMNLFKSDAIVFGTILENHHRFGDTIKKMSNVNLVTITYENRNSMVHEILEILEKHSIHVNH